MPASSRVVASPIILVYGLAGVGYVLVTAVSHLVIDRTKIELTLRSAPGCRHAGPDDGPASCRSGSPRGRRCLRPGSCSTSWPTSSVLFLAWALFLRAADPLDWWQDLVQRIAATTDWPGCRHGRCWWCWC